VIQPQTVKKVTRETLRLRASMYWHVLAGQTVWPVQVAVRYKIPLIIWGHHQGLDQVGMFSHTDDVEMSRKYRKEHDLMGLEAEDLLAQSDLKEDDLQAFFYPHDKEIAKVGVRGLYLGNYIRWDTKAQHEGMIARYGYETAAQARTFDTYNDVDCIHYSGLHDYLKFLKHGYGKVTDHASREIRFGRLTRDEGIALVKAYQDLAPADLPQFLAWIGMSRDEFYALVNAHRDPRLWQRGTDGAWMLLHSVAAASPPKNAAQVALPRREDCVFQITPSRAPTVREDEYVLIDRGYVDVLHQIARQHDRPRIGAVEVGIGEEARHIHPIKLPGVVKGFGQVLRTDHAVLGPEHGQRAVAGYFQRAEDRKRESGHGESRRRMGLLQDAQAPRNVLRTYKGRGCVDAARLRGGRAAVLQPIQGMDDDGRGGGMVVGQFLGTTEGCFGAVRDGGVGDLVGVR
jgi:hypothetical protein